MDFPQDEKEETTLVVDDILRQLYVLGLNWLVVEDEGRRWVLHKEKLIAYIGMGLAGEPVLDVLAEKGKPLLNEPVELEDKKVLLISQGKSSVKVWDELLNTVPDLPPWWEVPVPVVRINRESLDLNEEALSLFPEISLSSSEIKILIEKGELIYSLNETDRLFLHRMKGSYFFVEDIGKDLSVAEDIGWWSSVGKALVERLRRENYNVERVNNGLFDRSDEKSEFLPCGWNGELLGYLKIYKK